MKDLKREHRTRLRSVLSEISLEDKMSKSKKVAKNLQSFLISADFSAQSLSLENLVLGSFAPMSDEPFWPQLLDEMIDLKTAFPVELSGESKMGFVSCAFSELLTKREFGVELQVPPYKTPLVEPHLFLVPGLGFSKDGHRLGRGRGFYDRYLEGREGLCIGICFEEQISTNLPFEALDKLMNVVITDNNIYMTRSFVGSFKE